MVRQVRLWPHQFLVKVFYFFPLRLANVASLTLQRDSLFDRPLEYIIHTDIQNALT